MRRRTRIAVAAGLLASVGALLVSPMASAQGKESMLAVRGIDGTDRENVAVTFLYTGAPQELENLTIREDGQEKKIKDLTNLSKTEQGVRTVYVIDTSGSMGDDGALSDVKKGLGSVVDSLPAGDEVAIVSFNDAVVLESGFTDNADQLNEAIDGLAAPRDGKSASWDGVRKATQLLDTNSDLQPNIVLITDGQDDASKTTVDAAKSSVITSGAAFFAVELDHDGGADAASIQSIMDRTGGASFTASKGKGTQQAFEDLAATLQSQYVATYASTITQGQVDVTVSVGNLEREASYVAGANVQGAATAEVVEPDSGFGPEWLRGKFGGAVGLALVGLAVGLGAYAIASLASSTDESLNAVLRPYSEGPVPGEDPAEGALAQTALLQRAVELTEEFAERQGFLVKVEQALERADLPLRAAEALFFYSAGAVLVSLLAFVLGGFTTGLIVLGLCLLVPPAAVNYLAGQRSKKFQTALPDMLNLLSGSLRAGYSLLQGVEAVSKEVEDPMGQELRRVITEARLGREIEDAMEAVSERMGSADFAWAVMAIRIQREVGGNLSDLLLTVADTMVHRERLRRDIAALTAEGKMSAIILGLLPVGLGAFMWMSNPVYMGPLGSTTMGHILLGLALVSLFIGFAWMKKIIDIKI
jgi:tight adherence protein B